MTSKFIVETTDERFVYEEAMNLMAENKGKGFDLELALRTLNHEYAKTKETMVILHGIGTAEYWNKKLQASADLIAKLEGVKA